MGILSTTPNPYALGSPYMNNLIAERRAKAQPLASTIAELEKPFAASLGQAISSPGLKDKEVESIINKGTDEISAGQEAAALALGQEFGASGAGRVSGSAAKAARLLNTDVLGQKANLARDVRTDAATNREQLRLGALEIASRPILQDDAQKFSLQQQHDPRLTAAGYEAGGGFTGLKGLPSGGSGQISIQSSGGMVDGPPVRQSLGGGPRVIGGGSGIQSSSQKGPGITHFTGKTPYGPGTFKNGFKLGA